MKKFSIIFLSILLLIILTACNIPVTIIINGTPDANQLATDVAATLNAGSQGSPAQVIPSLTSNYTPTITLTPAPEPGVLQGYVTYPYGSIPRLTISAYKQNSQSFSFVINEAGLSTYYMATQYLTPGQWLVVAYDSLGNSGGCTTYVTIQSNQATTCNITDWTTAYPARKAGVPNP